MSYNKKNEFFQMVRTGLLEKIKEFVETEGFEAAAEMAKTNGENGETPLLIAIAHSQIEVFRYLLTRLRAPIEQTGQFLWDGNEYLEIHPLHAAIVSNQCNFVNDVIRKEEGSSDSSVCLRSIMSSSLPRQQKIDALQLIGSAYIFFGSSTAFRFGIPCLKEALLLRHQSTEDGHKDFQLLLDRDRNTNGKTFEITTLEQLEQIAGDYHELFIQAYIISQRLLNRLVPGPKLYFLNFLGYYVVICVNGKQYKRVISTCLLLLELFQDCDWEGLTFREREIFVDSLEEMIASFQILFKSETEAQELTFANVMIALDAAFAHVSYSHTQPEYIDDPTVELTYWGPMLFDKDVEIEYIVHLISFACDMLPKASAQQSIQFRKNLSQFIQRVEHSGLSKRHLLHFACKLDAVPTNLIELLLAVGADPNATDSEGCSPLHLLANKTWSLVVQNIKAAEILLSSGAHLDHVNRVTKLTPQQLFRSSQKSSWARPQLEPLHQLFNIVLPLKCQCAKAIQQQVNQLPVFLHDFARIHHG